MVQAHPILNCQIRTARRGGCRTTASRRLLYFYPKDIAPGCTKQAYSFRDLTPQFWEKEAVIQGASRDIVALHKRF